MLNKISFKNYKAFAEGEVKIKPITILLGANSVGKSSIMQLFLMLQQTALSEKNYKSALRLHGGFVSLGEGLNLLRKKDNTKVLTIEIDFHNAILHKELTEEYFANFCRDFFYFSTIMQKFFGKKMDSNKGILNSFKKIFTDVHDEIDLTLFKMTSKELIKHYNRESFYSLVNEMYNLISAVDEKDFPEKFRDDIFYYRHSSVGGYYNHFKNLKERKEEYLLTFDFLEGMTRDTNNAHFNISYDIIVNEKSLVLNKVLIASENNELICLEFDSNPTKDFRLQSISGKNIDKEKISNRTIQSVREIFTNPKTIFSFVKEFNDTDKQKNNVSPFANILQLILNSTNSITSNYFENDNINYVSPLRAHPKRYYFLDKAKMNAYVDTLDGDAIAETLKENMHLKNQVNSWLEKFNLKVDVQHLEDIIHKLQVNQNSLNLDITDVGFGISQVLPVIIQGFLSHNHSLTLIEQPEIHLHPKMQADLADLFIDIVISKSAKHKPYKYLFIETHSEYLLRRLRRRISDGTISAEHVAIYLIDPDKNDQGAAIRELKVEERGQFEWPVDFYGGELLKDTTEFIKNQQKLEL